MYRGRYALVNTCYRSLCEPSLFSAYLQFILLPKFDASFGWKLNMPGTTKEDELSIEDDDRTLRSLKLELKSQIKRGSSLPKRVITKCSREGNGNGRLKKKNRAIKHKNRGSKKRPSVSSVKDKPVKARQTERVGADDRNGNPEKLKRRRRRKNRKNNVILDEASRLQRRTRYLLIKIKLEQNLIDAYSTEGWKGQSREKIKPEKELSRAKVQILRCKLGIREAIHQLDLLGSEGRIIDSAISPDGSVHHDNIICAKCNSNEALPDNDIILCDGTCNCAFHQKCIDPPMLSENIPPEDEGWLCKFCKKKMEILEATNAHLGTHFPLNSNWEDVFREESALPDDGNSMFCQQEEWPSDDSEDDDYDPDRIGNSSSDCESGSYSHASGYSSSLLGSLEDETVFASRSNEEGNIRYFDSPLNLIEADSNEMNDGDVVSHSRQRAVVNYIKLHDEMFGKNAAENEHVSEDEDWGPTKRRRKMKESDAATTLMTLGETDKKDSEEKPSGLIDKGSIEKIKRPMSRLPHDAIEKLRLVFAETELPERSVRVSLSRQLGLEFEKVNKWFKNARYLALKARKTEGPQTSQDVTPSTSKKLVSEIDIHNGLMKSRHRMASQSPQNFKKFVRRKAHSLTNAFKRKWRRKPSLHTAENNQPTVDPGDDVSLKHLREKAKEAKKKLNRDKSSSETLKAEVEMERLCKLKSRVEKLQQVLLQLPTRTLCKATTASNSNESSIIYVPVAEVKEKR